MATCKPHLLMKNLLAKICLGGFLYVKFDDDEIDYFIAIVLSNISDYT